MLNTMARKSRIGFLNKHTAAGNEFKLHSHNCYEIIYFLSGGEIVIEGVRHPVTKDTCCIIAPHTEHKELLDSNGEILFIGFECTEGLPLSTTVNKVDKSIRLLFEKIIEEYSNQNYGYEFAADALLDLLIITYIRLGGKEGKKCKDLDYIKSYIEQYYNQKINFAELAKLSGYDYDYFRHLFKQKFGCSPQNYMINIRLDNARKLLTGSNLTCTEIAYHSGFSTSAQMTTMIKRRFGKTPKQMKNTD